MHKTAFVVVAAFLLSACASLAPLDTLGPAASLHVATDAKVLSEPVGVADYPIVVSDRAMDAPDEMTPVSAILTRRAFGSPTRSQPDLRPILATAADRARAYRGRRRLGRVRA
jgi:hypothetical protein